MASDKPQSTYEEVLAGIGPLAEIEVFHNQIIIGTYIRPAVSPGGIHFTDKTLNEDQWQGKVGVVLAKGPLAFQNDGSNDFRGQDVKIGDWVVYRISDGFPIDINGVHCRLLEDTDIRLRVQTPTIIY